MNKAMFFCIIIIVSIRALSQDILPVVIEPDRIIYRIGTSMEYARMLPVALPDYVVLYRQQFDLFPGLSDPEIKKELIDALDHFNPETANLQEKVFFLQNLAHLVLLDINNVKRWKLNYEQSLNCVSKDNRLKQKTQRVSQLMADYIRFYLPLSKIPD